MNMNSTEIAAYLGAMAWIPQVLKWIYKIFTKPLITVIPEEFVSVGFTSWGPIFNLRLSINVDRKDTFIDFIGVRLLHEDGSTHFLKWAGMTEFFSEVKNDRGESQTVQRDVVPISLKLSTLSIVERYFRFQDAGFIDANRIKLDELTEHQMYMKKHDPSYHDAFLKSKNFEDYLKFFREQFWWKAGKYTVSFIVRSPAKVKVLKSTFEFQLTQDNIDNLKNNLNELKVPIENYIKKGVPNFVELPMPIFTWLNPALKKLAKENGLIGFEVFVILIFFCMALLVLVEAGINPQLQLST